MGILLTVARIFQTIFGVFQAKVEMQKAAAGILRATTRVLQSATFQFTPEEL